MQLPSTVLVAAVGAIVAAFITSAVSFVNIIVSKDQKISEGIISIPCILFIPGSTSSSISILRI
jgi:hypothetical protein